MSNEIDALVKRGRGRPRLTEEEKKRRAMEREQSTPPEPEFDVVGNPTSMGKYHFPNTTLPKTESGEMSRYIRHALENLKQPPIDISDPKQVENRIFWYFEHCANHDMKPTVTGFRNALGIKKQTLVDWKNGTYRKDSHQAIILRAYDLLEELWEMFIQNNKMNVIAAIFLGKNNFGYTDKQEHIITPNNGLEPADISVIEEKYAELPDYEED